MTLNFSSLTLFLLCSIGEAHARIHTHMNVLDMEEGDRLFGGSGRRLIKNPETGKSIRTDMDGHIFMDDDDQHFASWSFMAAGTGDTTYAISNDGPSKSVCLLGRKDSVKSAKCDEKSRDQNWNIMKDENTSQVRIKYKKDNTCMAVQMDSSGSYNLTLQKCNNNKYQKFDILPVGKRGIEHIIPTSDDQKCMEAKRNSKGDFVVVAGSCKRGEGVGWFYEDRTNQFVYIDGSSNKRRCLDSLENGVATINECNADIRHQKWRKNPSTNGKADGTIESFDFKGFCMKLNMSTSRFNLRPCDKTKSDQQFTYGIATTTASQ